MNKKTWITLTLTLLQPFFLPVTFAQIGNLFTVNSSGTAITAKIRLCLNGYGPTSCENYDINGASLAISTNIPNHIYPQVGIKVLTGGYTPTGCTNYSNGYCIFSANNVTTTPITLTSSSGMVSIGQSYAGGIVACLNGGQNNLIAATADVSSLKSWGGGGIATGATSTSSGSDNTTLIVATLGAGTGYAAGVCDDYEIDSQGNTPCQGGNTCYNDWFLPAVNQLECLYTNQSAVGGFNPVTYYWTSTEIDPDTANLIFFDDGSTLIGSKNVSRKVRCVRTFTP